MNQDMELNMVAASKGVSGYSTAKETRPWDSGGRGMGNRLGVRVCVEVEVELGLELSLGLGLGLQD